MSGLIGFTFKAPLINLPLPIIPKLHIVLSHQVSIKAPIDDADSSVTMLGVELRLLK